MCNARTATAKKAFPDKHAYAREPVDNECSCLRCFVVSNVIVPLTQQSLRDERRRTPFTSCQTFQMNLRFAQIIVR
jgi:hypothetical protein